MEQGDNKDGEAARAAVVQVCAQALRERAARGKTFDIYSDANAPQKSWSKLFPALKLD